MHGERANTAGESAPSGAMPFTGGADSPGARDSPGKWGLLGGLAGFGAGVTVRGVFSSMAGQSISDPAMETVRTTLAMWADALFIATLGFTITLFIGLGRLRSSREWRRCQDVKGMPGRFSSFAGALRAALPVLPLSLAAFWLAWGAVSWCAANSSKSTGPSEVAAGTMLMTWMLTSAVVAAAAGRVKPGRAIPEAAEAHETIGNPEAIEATVKPQATEADSAAGSGRVADLDLPGLIHRGFSGGAVGGVGAMLAAGFLIAVAGPSVDLPPRVMETLAGLVASGIAGYFCGGAVKP